MTILKFRTNEMKVEDIEKIVCEKLIFGHSTCSYYENDVWVEFEIALIISIYE